MSEPMQSSEASREPEGGPPSRGRTGEPTQDVVMSPAPDIEEGSLARWLGSPAKAGTVAGGVVLGAAVLLGPLEVALGAGAAYAAYRVVLGRGAGKQKDTTGAGQTPERQEPKAA